VVANHLPLRLLRETEDSYDFEKDDDALIGHIQVRFLKHGERDCTSVFDPSLNQATPSSLNGNLGSGRQQIRPIATQSILYESTRTICATHLRLSLANTQETRGIQ